ncbi:hypothetical protein ABTF55_19900, partial [Acinetobacter baumannii]
EDFKKMHDLGMYLVWSPRSNFRLYGQTADILLARAAGVKIALSPDWTISGSSNLLDEMRFAYAYSQKSLNGALQPEELYRMITSDAAEVAGQ